MTSESVKVYSMAVMKGELKLAAQSDSMKVRSKAVWREYSTKVHKKDFQRAHQRAVLRVLQMGVLRAH